MVLFRFINVKKYYGDELILSIDNMDISQHDRIGIVGANGAGKTTFLNLIAGKTECDEGKIIRSQSVEYFEQFCENAKMDAVDGKLMSEFSLSSLQAENAESFSGGEKTKIRIANMLSRESVVVLADEPTCNLDIKGIELVKNKLQAVDTLLLVSHDRALLDELCNKIIEIHKGEVTVYEGNYSMYLQQKEIERITRKIVYQNYLEEKKHLTRIYESKLAEAKKVAKKPRDKGQVVYSGFGRSKGTQQKGVQNTAKVAKRKLEKLEAPKKPEESEKIKMKFNYTSGLKNKTVISAAHLTVAYEERRLLEDVSFAVCNHEKIAIIGENGTGKTTLLNYISERREGIECAPQAKIAYLQQQFEQLDSKKTVMECALENNAQTMTLTRIMLARLLFRECDLKKRVGMLSGGEKMRLCFFKLMVSGADVLLLDEPTNYLDIESTEAIEGILREYEGTVLLVSHDMRFVEAVADKIWCIQDKKLIDYM